MHAIFRFYRYINTLSLDIAAGAVVSAQLFARIFNVQIKTYGLMALGLTVWIIYTLDHLRDAKKIKHSASTERHRFHQQNFKVLVCFLVIAVLVDALTIFFIRRQVLAWGLVLWAIVVLYLTVQQFLRFLKEFFIAGLYTWGVLLLSITVTSIDLGVHHTLLIVQFAIAAWINLVLFSWFDHVFDERDEQNSFVTIMGNRTTIFFLYGLFAASALITLVQVMVFTISGPVMILAFMIIILLIIFLLRRSLAKNDLYRLLGDAVFLMPAIYLIWPQ
ncbi:MAG TPA: hypothetical protein VFZ52_08240 [Chryseolinea sp.]